tara:strand:+ start:217 stop:531 length:315 start_codon:yes stop_codon:yes gene_type:complete
MLDGIIKKLQVILGLCLVTGLILYFTPLGDLINGEVEKKVEEFKEDVKEKIDDKKKEVKKEVKKVEDKVKSNIKEVEDKVESNVEEVKEKIEDLKKLKLRDIIK